MRVIAVANRKGGVGKTTLAVAVAGWLARSGRVLLVDLDSQANATEALGVTLRPGVLSWLVTETPPQVVELGGALALLPGNVGTEKANLCLSGDADIGGIDRRLKRLKGFEVVVLDCPPSSNMLTRAALYAADEVLIPTLPEYLSVAGVRQLTVLLAQIRERYERPVRLLGVQVNKYRRNTTEHRLHLEDLVRVYKGAVWPPLRQSIAVARACAQARPVWDVLRGKVLREWEQMAGRVVR